MQVLVSPEQSYWEYVQYEGCRSSDPRDCLALCYLTQEAEYVWLDVVADTTLGNPIRKKIAVKYVKQPQGTMKWVGIDCYYTQVNELNVQFTRQSDSLTIANKAEIEHVLLCFLQDYPSVQIVLSAHTDSHGFALENQRLSERRVRAIVDYLVQRGIPREQIVPKCYGESRLKNRCADGVRCTEYEHAENNRIEYQVLMR